MSSANAEERPEWAKATLIEGAVWRRARKPHPCNGRSYENGCAVLGSRCPDKIEAGEWHIEYLYEALPFQSGTKYHAECGGAEGLYVAPPIEPAALTRQPQQESPHE